MTTYYMIPTENPPLLEPLRSIPVLGNPLAALIQPDLKVIVNLGFGDPAHGYSTGPANIPTPFGLFPPVSPGTVLSALAAGTQQGIDDFAAELPVAVSTPSTWPSVSLPYVQALMPPPSPVPATPENIVNTVASIISTDYAILLPTADTALSFMTSVPVYDAGLFVSGVEQGSIVSAVGDPIAATVGLLSFAGFVEFIVILESLISNIQALQSLTF